MDAEFPTFTLATTKNYVFVAGGGGSEEYGKKNGVLAYRKSSMGKKDEKAEDFFKTSDIILQLFVFADDPNERNTEFEKLSIAERPAIAEKLEMSGGEDSTELEKTVDDEVSTPVEKSTGSEKVAQENVSVKSETDKVQDESTSNTVSTKKSLSEPEESSKTVARGRKLSGPQGTPTESRASGKPDEVKIIKTIFVIAVGDKKLYALEYNGKFSARCISETKIKQAYLNEHLILLRNSLIVGFYNFTEQKKPNLKFKIKKFHENQKSLTEEFVYRLYKKNDEIVVLNEQCTDDIPEDWNKFFIFGNAIHKVVKLEGKNIFVFQNRKYEVEGEMSEILVSKDRLVFFSRMTGKSQLYFINHTKKTYDIQNATAIAQFERTAAVATSDGHVTVYVDASYANKYRVTDMPISGLSIDAKRIYYCTVTGELGVAGYSSRSRFLSWTMAIVVLIFTIMISLLTRYYRK